MNKIFLLLLVAVCAHAQDFYFPGRQYSRTSLGDAVDKSSMKLMKESYAASDDKNVILSPLGLFTLLSLYAAGAEGPVRDEIQTALNFDDYEKFSHDYTYLTERFSNMDASYLVIANKVCVSNQYTIKDMFRQVAESNYKAEVNEVDFGKADETAAIINEWSNNKTKGQIPEPIDPKELDSDIAAALFNVIFFQGHWSVPFNASNTEDKDFHVDKSTTVKKPTMKLQQSLFIYDSPELSATLVELPYEERNFRMVVVVPTEVDGLNSVLEKVARRGLLEDTFKLNPSGREIILEIPKFEVKSKHNFNQILPKVGMSKLFTTAVTGVVERQPVLVSKAFQEAVVKVDEEGATASAFTGAVIVPMSSNSEPPAPLPLKVDHPFLYAILQEDVVLFLGTYTH